MPSITFTSGTTITSAWLNDTNTIVYTILGNGTTAPSTKAIARTNLGLAIGTDVQAYNANLTSWAAKTIPTGTVVGDSDTQTLTNKTITVKDNAFTLQDNGDSTKQAVFELSGITTGTTRTFTVGNYSGYLIVAPNEGTATQVLTSNGAGSQPTFQTVTTTNSSIRQTVLSGPVDTSGFPSFVPASAAGLTLTTQNITASAPLVVSAAGGSGANGEINSIGQATANFSWPAMNNGVTWYGYVTISGGTLTTSWTGLAPIYQWGGTPSTTSGQLTYNIQEGKMYLGNGTTAPAINGVVLLQATSSAGNISSVIPYQYMGQYDSGFTATLPTTNTAFSKNHYLGLKPGIIDLVIECTSAEFGYSVGDQIHAASIRTVDGVPAAATLTLASNLLSVFGHTAATASFQAQSNTTGAFSTLTLASWKWKILASRGW